ncbi:DME family drug/metabolite transporter [Microcella putealis]|uniref:DME family drug/metabolite transporter n=1 Tax=Microcella putealis TaxID=337005 RepID=A0A4Q7LVU6_9MICO|nr:DME family drug/metabolite transporter [Microcella putealis]TQM24020.1 DME family drug/metabolite transporter [Microcella putealis]
MSHPATYDGDRPVAGVVESVTFGVIVILAVWAVVVASVLWGTTGTAATFLSREVSPLATGSATMAIGGVLLFAVAARPAGRAIADRAARPWLLVGAIGVVVYPLAFYSSMSLAGVAIGNVVSLGSGPLFAALLEWRVTKKPLTRQWMLAAAIAITGVIMLALGGHGGDSPVDAAGVPWGVALGLLAGASYALYTFTSGEVMARGHSSRATMGAVFGLGAIPLAVVLMVTGAPLLASPSNLAIIGYLAVGPMFVAYVLFGIGLRQLRSSVVTVITLLEPLVATLLAIVIVGERLDPLGWAGLAVILVGIAALSPARRPRPGQSRPYHRGHGRQPRDAVGRR